MENTLENKAKFFAQYWGQNVMMWNEADSNSHQKIGVSYMTKYGVSNRRLELKPLSSITDEDYKFIMNDKVMNPDLENGDPLFTFAIGGLRMSDLTTTDFLRSKGYALPWMGLSVEKLVEYGWIKLKED
ncbi:hypothetical protein [Chryseobacterium sp.]|uniref:hypothetical protein n=1 Tax=Chryseobacterium sp. TaxID=1871047 RepID=UPI0024E1BF21|nr:hypothetical protein [Chryseobacterium sp.]